MRTHRTNRSRVAMIDLIGQYASFRWTDKGYDKLNSYSKNFESDRFPYEFLSLWPYTLQGRLSILTSISRNTNIHASKVSWVGHRRTSLHHFAILLLGDLVSFIPQKSSIVPAFFDANPIYIYLGHDLTQILTSGSYMKWRPGVRVWKLDSIKLLFTGHKQVFEP